MGKIKFKSIRNSKKKQQHQLHTVVVKVKLQKSYARVLD